MNDFYLSFFLFFFLFPAPPFFYFLFRNSVFDGIKVESFFFSVELKK